MGASEAQKKPIIEINLERALQGLELTMEQFVDLCILMGCDYSDTIKGIGPINALKLIKEHENIEGVVAHLQKSGKHQLPEPFPYEEARTLFMTPLVADPVTTELKWSEPDVGGCSRIWWWRSSSTRAASRRPSSGYRSARARIRRTGLRVSLAP